jgi:hypothetical protein
MSLNLLNLLTENKDRIVNGNVSQLTAVNYLKNSRNEYRNHKL